MYNYFYALENVHFMYTLLCKIAVVVKRVNYREMYLNFFDIDTICGIDYGKYKKHRVYVCRYILTGYMYHD